MAERGVDMETLLGDLITYDGYAFPFVDRYAQFGVTFERARALGPGMLQVRSAAFTNQVTCSTLRLWAAEEGRPVAVQRSRLRSLPWCAIEEATVVHGGRSVAVTARHVYMDERALLSEFTFRNDGAEQVSCAPWWVGQFSGDRFGGANEGKRYGYAKLPVRETWAQAEGLCIRGGLRGSRGSEILPLPAIQITAGDSGLQTIVSRRPVWRLSADDAGEGTIGGLLGESIHYVYRSPTVTLEPGAARTFRFVTELSVATRLDPVYHFRKLDPSSLVVDDVIQDARDDFERRIGIDTPPDVGSGRPLLLRAAWRARWAMLRTGYRAQGRAGEYGDGLASTCVPSCSGFTRVFFWDSLFTSVALTQFEPELARGAITAVFSRQKESGLCPEHSFNYHVPARDVIGAPQAPVASWAVRRYLEQHPDDTAFLGSVYPLLVRNHDYWTVRGDKDGDGLAEWTWSGQTADDSPLFDAYKTERGCGWLPPVASVQLNAFLYSDAMLLAELSERLDMSDEAAGYRSAAAQRAEAMMRICFVEDEKRFWDYDHAANRHTRVKTFYMFWPVWARMPMPEAVKKELIEDVLLDEKQFFGDIPFPSVAYDEPAYTPTGYWRGRCWPHISYWLLEMLAREGYAEQADDAAYRLIAACMREPAFPENLASDPGLYFNAGQPDYNWGAAAFYLIATGAYRGRS